MMNPTISSQLLGINEESDVLLNEIHENTKDMGNAMRNVSKANPNKFLPKEIILPY